MTKKILGPRATKGQRQVAVDLHIVFARQCGGRIRADVALTTESLIRRWGYRRPSSVRELTRRTRAVARALDTLNGRQIFNTDRELAGIRKALAARPSVRRLKARDMLFDEGFANCYAANLIAAAARKSGAAPGRTTAGTSSVE